METSVEYILSKMSKDEMIAAIHSHSGKFIELIELALSKENRMSPSAAWLLRHCVDENIESMGEYVPRIIDHIPEVCDGQQRDYIYLLQKVELNEDQEGLVFDICVELWKRVNKIPSVRYVAMKLILQIAEKYPELVNEISLLAQNFYLEPLSPGIKNSINRMIKNFEKSIKARL